MENSIKSQYKNIFLDPDVESVVVEYSGDIIADLAKLPGYNVIIINDKYAVISYDKDSVTELDSKEFPTIKDIKVVDLFTLQDISTTKSISPLDAAEINYTHVPGNPLYLTGRNVTVGIIDTGIDYLNKEFMDEDNKTRIHEIWDQNIDKTVYYDGRISVGEIFTKEDIDKAIDASRRGEDPYSIVPSKDEIGHGTSMAGIIAGSGKNPEYIGAAPECEIVVVKLVEAKREKAENDYKVPVYGVWSVFSAIRHLVSYSLNNLKPMVIYLPLGSNYNNHHGNGFLEDYIDAISINRGIVVITGAGNEGAAGGHTSGNITTNGESSILPLYISPEQRKITLSVWINTPNIMTIEIISPSGEGTGAIPALVNSKETYSFIFEKTKVVVRYYLPEESSGDELIRVEFSNLQPGTWNIKLQAVSVIDGRYNAWIPVQGITVGDTRFLISDPYNTMTDPGTSSSIIAVASYNQNNNNLVNSSGWASYYDYVDRIDIAAGGVNVKALAPNNEVTIVNGTSVAAAVVAGACALLFEWGIINGNDPYMYSQTIKTYITRGTHKRSGDKYPNPQWGYGALRMIGVFGYMR